MQAGRETPLLPAVFTLAFSLMADGVSVEWDFSETTLPAEHIKLATLHYCV